MLIAAPFRAADEVPCIAPHVHSPVGVADPTAISSRIFFRKQGTADWYFMILKPGPTGFFGVLPQPLDGVSIEYQIETTDAGGKQTRSAESSLSPSASCQPALNPDQMGLASNLVVGKTVDTQTDLPPGFECPGVVGIFTASGALQTYNCKKGVLATPVMIGAAAVVAGAAGYVIYKEISRSHP